MEFYVIDDLLWFVWGGDGEFGFGDVKVGVGDLVVGFFVGVGVGEGVVKLVSDFLVVCSIVKVWFVVFVEGLDDLGFR